MSFKTAWVRFGSGKQHSGFLAWPRRAVAPLPAVVVIHGVWGLDLQIEDVTLRFAKAGYAALAPDSVGALLSADPDQLDALVPKLVDAATFLRSEHSLTRGAKVGAVGFGMGGALSARLACAYPRLDAAVVFYGNAPPAEQVPNVGCRVLGLYGGLDDRVNGGIADFSAAMLKHGKRFEHHVYEGARHAFFNDGRPSYHANASRDAFARTLEFFRRELAGSALTE